MRARSVIRAPSEIKTVEDVDIPSLEEEERGVALAEAAEKALEAEERDEDMLGLEL